MKYADQGGMKNYLGKQPMVDAPKYWRSGPDAPPTELAYITDAEKDMIMKANLHGSLSQGPNEGPSGIMSLDSQGDYTRDRSSSGPQRSGGSRQERDRNEQHMREILTGQKNIGQTSRVSDRVRQGAVPEFVNTPGGMKYLGSAYKDTGRRSFLSRLFGGSNRYGYSPVKGLKSLRTRGVPGQRGYEYYSDDEEIGETKPGYGGRILGGLMSLLTGIPLVGGALGTAYDYGKGIFGPKQRDMSQFNKLSLTLPENQKVYLPQGSDIPMARLDRFSKPISKSPMSDPMWSNQPNRQILDVMANNPSALTYGEVLANQNRANNMGIMGIPFNNPVGGVDQFAREMQKLEYSIPRAPGQIENVTMPINVSDMGGTLQDFYTNRNLTGAATQGKPTDANTQMEVWDDFIDWNKGGRMYM